MYLYGKNSIKERLKAHPSSVSIVWVIHHFEDQTILRLIKKNKISLKRQSSKDVGRFVPGKKHQGIVAKVSGPTYQNIEKILSQKKLPHLMILNKVQDPQNLGTILRTLACFGEIILCLTKKNSCLITESVLHVASGGENYVPICLINSLSPFLEQIKKKGYTVSGTFVHEGHCLYDYRFPHPSAVLLGSEHSGLEKSLKKHMDTIINIPMNGVKLSLNINNSASIIAYEMLRSPKV